ncbi:MAG: hypothetical protein MUP22_11605 [Desulfobacterales bacterium]|nr:hypothetical protein [Desulfobacterales bacterium]
MNRTKSISIALAVTLVLAVVSISVWAAPARQGTVPIPPYKADLLPNIPVTLGTVEITCTCSGIATRITDPEADIGPAPEGFSFLSDAVTIELQEECDITVCYPYPPEVEEQNGEIYKWDEDTELWVAVEGIISGDPPKICYTDEDVIGGTYVLIGE